MSAYTIGLTKLFSGRIVAAMDKIQTKSFVSRTKAEAKRRGDSVRTISKRLFNGNPYAIERLEVALKKGSGGPGHVAVVEAERLLLKMEQEEVEDESRALA